VFINCRWSVLQVAAALAVIVLGTPGPAAGAQVEGRIRRVGLFAGANPIVRSGNWSFVEVELRWSGERALDGELRVDQLDRDGDVAVSVLRVALVPDGEWHRYQVYFVPHDVIANDRVRVKLHNDRGELVKMLDETGQEVAELVSAPVYDFSAEEFLIVDLTTPRKLAHLAWLDSARLNRRGWANARKIRGMSPRELPSRWQGLEAVDAMVWDNADPSALSPQQIVALTDWVRAGGRLLISASTNWQALANSPIARVLPVTIEGVRRVTEAQEFLELVQDVVYEKKLDKHYSKNPITRCRMSPLMFALPIPADCPNPQIAYRHLLGRGSITFLGASLQELLPVPPKIAQTPEAGPLVEFESPGEDPFVRICEKVVGNMFLALPKEREEQGSTWRLEQPENLFRKVRDSVGFASHGAAYLVFAVLFAIAYTLGGTFGSYWYLKRRGWQHQAWIAFALVSVAGSVLGTGIVWTLRGVTTKVWQTTIVDGQSGQDYGYATCLFGVKTPDHTRLDLRLPVGAGDDAAGPRFGPLRAMPEAAALGDTGSTFVAPENYEFDVLHSRLIDVPVRATLKEFQGFWHGPLGGTLDAKLVAKRTEDGSSIKYEFAEGSYVRNNLGVDLRDCIILETREEVATRGALVACFDLGDLPKSGPGSLLEGEQIRQRLFYQRATGAGSDEPLQRIKKRPRLDERIKRWVGQLLRFWGPGDRLRGKVATGEQEVVSLFLLSVFDLLEDDPQGRRILRRSHGRRLDCTHQLTNRTAILIGWSEDRPPAVLEVNRAAYRPDRSRTIYRFVIPVERPRM
jgi:hypothetical protein